MKSGRNADTKPFFPLYVDDWMSAQRTLSMTLSAQGAFVRALCLQWRDGHMPSSTSAWSLIFPTLSAGDLETVLAAFPACGDGFRRNARLERERAIADQIKADRRRGAEKTNAKRTLSARSAHAGGSLPPRNAQAQAQAHQKKPPRAARTGPHAELIQFWEESWIESRQTPYAVEPKDGVAAAAILKLAAGDLAEAKRRALALLGNQDAWMVQNASLPLLRSRWNQLAVTVLPRSKSALQNTLDGLEAMGMSVEAKPLRVGAP